MKGAVLIIGSLLWETNENAVKNEQGKLREKWRETLDIGKKIPLKVPIRYGRKSTSRKCTYTMIFSNSQKVLGTAFIVPYLKEITSFEELKQQAIQLAEAEGISTRRNPNRLIAKSWGAVGIVFNNNSKNITNEIKDLWHNEFKEFDNTGYGLDGEEVSIKENGELNFQIEIPDSIDYVFATPVKPNVSKYPTVERIAEAIIESNPRYDTYLKENYNNGIRTEGDEEIINLL
jgi:hypothetical protein